jgi:hypothetical protein
MKYTLLIYSGRPGILLERKQFYREWKRLARQPKANGQGRAANLLQSMPTATIVRVRDGKCLVTDGPFAETHEALRIGHTRHEPAGMNRDADRVSSDQDVTDSVRSTGEADRDRVTSGFLQ